MPFPQLRYRSLSILPKSRGVCYREDSIFCSDYPSLLPARIICAFFQDFHCENLGRLLEINSIKVLGSLSDRTRTRMHIHTQPPAVHQNYHLSVPNSVWLQKLLIQSVASLQLYMCLQILWWQIALRPQFLMDPRTGHSMSQFIWPLILRQECRFLRCLFTF